MLDIVLGFSVHVKKQKRDSAVFSTAGFLQALDQDLPWSQRPLVWGYMLESGFREEWSTFNASSLPAPVRLWYVNRFTMERFYELHSGDWRKFPYYKDGCQELPLPAVPEFVWVHKITRQWFFECPLVNVNYGMLAPCPMPGMPSQMEEEIQMHHPRRISKSVEQRALESKIRELARSLNPGLSRFLQDAMVTLAIFRRDHSNHIDSYQRALALCQEKSPCGRAQVPGGPFSGVCSYHAWSNAGIVF